MKAKSFLLITGLAITLLATGCGNQQSQEPEVTEASAKASAPITGYLVEDASKYVTLGTYLGMDVEKPVYQVSDEEIGYEIEYRLSEHAVPQEVDRASDLGDTLTADITATLEGESEAALDETDYSIILGDMEFGEEFDQQLTGVKKGEEKSFTCTLDESAWYEEWIGKTMDFTVTVKNIEETIRPEYTEEFVQDTLGYDSKEEFEQSLKESLEANYLEQSSLETRNNALAAAMEASTFNGYPDDLYQSSTQFVKEQYESQAELYGMTMDELYEAYGITEEDLELEILDDVNLRLFISALCTKEDLTVTEEEYTQFLEEQYSLYGYESTADFEEAFGRDYIVWALYEQKAGDFLVEKANLFETPINSYEDLGFEEEDIDEMEGLEDGEALVEEVSEEDAEEISEEISEGDSDAVTDQMPEEALNEDGEA